MFSEPEIKFILQDFPKFELCYEIITHKKVHSSNAILAIPEGKKCFAWFTNYKSNNVCFLLELNTNKSIGNIKIINTIFIDKLSLGTIFYGTSFTIKDIDYFCVEDLYYYLGKPCNNISYLTKLEKIKDIFKNEISQTTLFNKFTIFGLPLILDDFQLFLREIQLLPYKVSEIKFRFFDKLNAKKILVMKYFKPGTKTNVNTNTNMNTNHKKHDFRKDSIFKITPDIEPDIYNLFVYNNGVEEYYDIAFIPDYKTSVMMNQLFRNIKENNNLDAIEESDDEEEFEDNREDKYVYLERSFKMKCEYNNKFKRWVPISLAETSDRIISLSLLKNY